MAGLGLVGLGLAELGLDGLGLAGLGLAGLGLAWLNLAQLDLAWHMCIGRGIFLSVQRISPFYRTLSSIGAAAQKECML